MTKKAHILYWIKNAEKDWKRASHCFRDKDFVFCLFCLHLSLEKLCKALWVKQNESNHPPRIHNLRYLISQTPLLPTEEQKELLTLLNTFQIEGRYPDYKGKIYKLCNKKYTTEILNKTKTLRKWLLNNLR